MCNVAFLAQRVGADRRLATTGNASHCVPYSELIWLFQSYGVYDFYLSTDCG